MIRNRNPKRWTINAEDATNSGTVFMPADHLWGALAAAVVSQHVFGRAPFQHGSVVAEDGRTLMEW